MDYIDRFDLVELEYKFMTVGIVMFIYFKVFKSLRFLRLFLGVVIC